MTYETKIEGFRELEPAEIALVAGGDGPTAGESEIQGIYDNSVITEQGSDYAFSNDGVMFYDGDGNGYYEYAEISIGGVVYVYDPVTHTWVPQDSDHRSPRNVDP